MLQELATTVTINQTTRQNQQTPYAASRAQSNPTIRQEIDRHAPPIMATVLVRLVLDDAPFFMGLATNLRRDCRP